jgi:hypothetical protein
VSTTDEVFTVLVDFQTTLGPGESNELDNILFVVLLTNPAYFDNQFNESSSAQSILTHLSGHPNSPWSHRWKSRRISSRCRISRSRFLPD